MVTQPPGKFVKKHKVVVTIPRRPRNDASTRKKHGLPLSETGWISALDAAQLLAAHDGDLDTAKSLLLESMQEGKLTSRASCWCQEADVGDVRWHDLEWSGLTPSREHKGQIEQTVFYEPAKGEEHVDLPSDLFLKSINWTIYLDDIQWEAGYFIAKRPAEFLLGKNPGPCTEKMIRRFAVGLQFHVKEIGAIATARTAEQVAADSGLLATRRGRPLHESWPRWVSELIVLYRKGSLTENSRASEILAWISNALTREEYIVPHKSNTSPVATAVIDTLKELAKQKPKNSKV